MQQREAIRLNRRGRCQAPASSIRLPSGFRSCYGGAILIAVTAALAYSNSFSAPFHLDDVRVIQQELSAQEIGSFASLFRGDRSFCTYSFQLNRAVHGQDVRGYHAVNLLIHVTAAWLLFGIVRRTLSRGRLAERYGTAASPIALTVALVWGVHPLQTESVTYLVQRFESLMGLAFLATLYAFVRAQDSARRARGWLGLSAAACAFGMGCKEVMFPAPLVVLWYDRAFIADSWRSLWRDRKWYYIALAATWLVLGRGAVGQIDAARHQWTTHAAADQPANPSPTESYTPVQYLLSQAGVLAHYLRLSVWPQGQCFDYGWRAAQAWTDIVPPGVLVVGLLGATLWAVFRMPEAGFLGAWFFLNLALRSSVLPRPDLAVEHRMYLPLAAVVAAAVLATVEVSRRCLSPKSAAWRLGPAAAAGVVVVLAATTFDRNRVYQTSLALWSDVVAKSPENPRGWTSLAGELLRLGDCRGALNKSTMAVSLAPGWAPAWNNHGLALMRLRKPTEAMTAFRTALEFDPNCPEAFLNMGKLVRQSDPQAAIENFRRALDLRPNYSEAHNNLGAMLAATDPVAAEDHYRRALDSDQDNAEACNNYANLLARRGRFAEAIGYYRKALALNPVLTAAEQNLTAVEQMQREATARNR